jgi:membrane protein required for colicin V production
MAVILSVVFIIFDSINKNLPFTDEEDLEESTLYKPVKTLIPSVFPLILEKKSEIEDNSDETEK